jgi:hypothetical protein
MIRMVARPVFAAALAACLAGSLGVGADAIGAVLPASQAAMFVSTDSGLSLDAAQALSTPTPAGLSVHATADYPPAVWIPAAPTNYSSFDRPIDFPVDMIVVHDIEGSATSAIHMFQDPNRHGSSHYVVSLTGKVWEMVLEKDVAWHAGNWDYNTRSIGIEHEGFAYTNIYTPTEYRASAHLIAAICSRWGVPMDRAHVIGHYQVPDPYHKGLFGGAEHHTDPGPYWNWTYYINYASYYASLLPSPPVMQRDPVAIPDDGSASVSWVPTPTCHTPISSYHVVLQPGNVVQDLPGDVTTATFTGLQNGTTYSMTVTAINPDGQSSRQSNSVIAGPHCATADLTSNLASPQLLGTRIQFSIASTGCPNPRYEFFIKRLNGTWEVGRSFGTGTTWTWDTAFYPLGTNTVRVWANQAGDTKTGEASEDFTITLTEPPRCTSAALSPSNPVQPAGSTISFTASATGCPVPLYEYWLQYPSGKWSMLQSFTTDATWSWNTSGKPPGKYTIRVWANHPGGSTKTYEVFGTSTVTLTGCTSASLSPASGSSAVGTPVTFTASASGCPNPVYEFWVMDTSGKWRRMTGFSTTNTWTWSNPGWAKGVYHIRAWANQQGAYTGTYETFGASTYRLT